LQFPKSIVSWNNLKIQQLTSIFQVPPWWPESSESFNFF